MPRRDEKGREAPRTDLPPAKDPYYEGYFGTDEEEGVVREEGEGEAGGKGAPARSGEREAERHAADDAEGGGRDGGRDGR